MGRTLTSPLQVARMVLMQNQAWLLFVQIPRRAGGAFRMVKASRTQTVSGAVWQPASIKIVLPEEDAEGTLGELSLIIPNVSRIPMAYVEVDGELRGQLLTAWLALEGQPLNAALSWSHLILSVKATEKAMTLKCGHPAEAQHVPARRFDRVSFPQLLPQGGLEG